MPKIYELIDNVAIQLLETATVQVWFSSLDLKTPTANSICLE